MSKLEDIKIDKENAIIDIENAQWDKIADAMDILANEIKNFTALRKKLKQEEIDNYCFEEEQYPDGHPSHYE